MIEPSHERHLEELHPASFGWALQCCRWDRQEAEEVLQTIYVKILAGQARFAVLRAEPAACPDPIAQNLYPPELIMRYAAAIGLAEPQRASIKEAVQKAQTKFLDAQRDRTDGVGRERRQPAKGCRRPGNLPQRPHPEDAEAGDRRLEPAWLLSRRCRRSGRNYW